MPLKVHSFFLSRSKVDVVFSPGANANLNLPQRPRRLFVWQGQRRPCLLRNPSLNKKKQIIKESVEANIFLSISSGSNSNNNKMATFTNNNIPSPVSLRRLRTFDIVPQHLLSVRGLNMQFIDLVLTTADEMKNLVHSKGGDDRLKHFVLATAFYEPSTRTSCSFQAAMLRLGGSVITLNEEQSSVKKGESLEDTIQTLSCYCDAVVLRHPVKGSAAQAAHVSTKPVINAGDGTGEHPTQALLDLYTIKSELGGALGGVNADSPMVITLLGDLKNG